MRHLALKIGLGLVAVLVIGAGIVWAFGLDYLRQEAADQVNAATGRDLSFNGETTIDWSSPLCPRIVFRDLTLSNAEWAERPNMITLERFEAVIDLTALLTFTIELPELIIAGLEANLEKREDGTDNWTFSESLATDAAVPEDRTDIPVIGRLIVRESAIRYVDPALELNIDAKIGEIIADANETENGDYGQVDVSAQGRYRGREIKADGVVGDPRLLRDAARPYPVKADISAGQTKIEVDGTIDDPLNFENFDLRIAVAGPNAEELFPLFGLATPETPPYALSAKVVREGALIGLRQLQGTVGDSDLSGGLAVHTDRTPIFLEGELLSKTLDFDDIGPLIGLPPSTDSGETVSKAQQQKARAAVESDRVLPDVPLDVTRLNALDAKLVYEAQSIQSSFAPLTDVSLKLDITDGVLKLEPLHVKLAGGDAVAFVTVDSNVADVSTAVDLRLRDISMAEIATAIAGENDTKGRMTGRVELHAIGNTVRDALSNANGQSGLVLQQGQISHLIVELAGLDVGQALGVLVDGDAPLPVRCAVGNASVENGVASINSLVLDTPDTKLTVNGDVALGREELDLVLRAHPKDISLLSLRTPVTVGGSFADPQIGIDPSGAALRAGAAIALSVLLTPIAGVLGFVELGLGEDADCAALINEADVQTSPAKSE